MFCPASDPRPSRRGRSRHRWSYRMSVSARYEWGSTNAPPACTSSCRDSPEECGLQTEQKSVCVRRMSSRQKRHVCRSRSRHRTIAPFMLTPCSASSMLFATLRPGPAGPSGIDDASARHVSGNYAMVGNLSITRRRVDAGIAQAYVGFITSVPHGTSSVRRYGQRSAQPASAHRARHRAHPHTSQIDARRPRAVRRLVY